jgi:hypothetical protein
LPCRVPRFQGKKPRSPRGGLAAFAANRIAVRRWIGRQGAGATSGRASGCRCDPMFAVTTVVTCRGAF